MQRWLILGAVLAALGALLYLHPETEAPSSRRASEEAGGTQGHSSLPGSSRTGKPAEGPEPPGENPSDPQAPGEEDDAPDLPGTYSLRGLVTDERGQPLEGVQVRASPSDNSAVETRARSKTDAQGRFRLRSLLPGYYDFSFARDRFLPLEMETRQLAASPPPLTVTLQAASLIEGRVVDARGTPMPGVDVLLYEGYRERSESERVLLYEKGTKTEPDGTFILDAPRPGPWVVETRLEGFASLQREVTSPAKDVWMVMGAGASLEVTVVDEHEQPLPHTLVRLWNAAEARTFQVEVTTDEAGHGVLQGLEAGEYGLLAMPSAPEDQRLQTARVLLHKDTPQQVRLRLGAGSHVSGMVTDTAGQPLADVEVSADIALHLGLPQEQSRLPVSYLPAGTHPDSPGSWLDFLWRIMGSERLRAKHEVRTGPDGRFTVPNLLPATHRLSFTKQGYTLVPPDSAEETAGGETLAARVGQGPLKAVMRYQGRVTGRVVRAADGEPLTSFLINEEPYKSPDGTFAVTAKPGRHMLELLVPDVGGLHQPYEARPGEDVELGDLVVGDGRAVRVRVLDNVTSLPLSGVHLELWEEAPEAELPQAEDPETERQYVIEGLDLPSSEPGAEHPKEREPLTALELGLDGRLDTSRDGVCQLPDVPARPLVLRARRRGYEPQTVRLGPHEQELTLRLRPWATVQGWVRVNGEPIAKGDVDFYDQEGNYVNDLEVRNGWFSGHTFRPGRYLVRADCDSCPKPEPVFLAQPVEVPGPQGTLSLDFQEAHGTTVQVLAAPEVRGLILLPGQAPPLQPDQDTSDFRLRHPSEPLINEAKGYEFRDVPAGRHTLLFYTRVGEEQKIPHRQEVEVPASGVLRLQVPRGAPRGQEGTATSTEP